MKIRTAQLTGPALDWAVAKCEGFGLPFLTNGRQLTVRKYLTDDQAQYTQKFLWELGYSTSWAQGGPIIDREMIQLTPHCMVNPLHGWAAAFRSFDEDDNVFALHRMRGRTPLRAAMRCYVASKLGDEVDVPEELLCPSPLTNSSS